jgi:ElaB/YqjD/DUF883 family membrane-anchored ribosome-binding protein
MSDISLETSRAHREKLVADLTAIVDDAEAILRDTAGQGGEKIAELRGRIQERLERAKVSLAEAQRTVMEKGRAAVHATDDFVHDQPWKAVGMAALVGLAIGVLIGRR